MRRSRMQTVWAVDSCTLAPLLKVFENIIYIFEVDKEGVKRASVQEGKGLLLVQFAPFLEARIRRYRVRNDYDCFS
jgi:hypothetical protein